MRSWGGNLSLFQFLSWPGRPKRVRPLPLPCSSSRLRLCVQLLTLECVRGGRSATCGSAGNAEAAGDRAGARPMAPAPRPHHPPLMPLVLFVCLLPFSLPCRYAIALLHHSDLLSNEERASPSCMCALLCPVLVDMHMCVFTELYASTGSIEYLMLIV